MTRIAHRDETLKIFLEKKMRGTHWSQITMNVFRNRKLKMYMFDLSNAFFSQLLLLLIFC